MIARDMPNLCRTVAFALDPIPTHEPQFRGKPTAYSEDMFAKVSEFVHHQRWRFEKRPDGSFLLIVVCEPVLPLIRRKVQRDMKNRCRLPIGDFDLYDESKELCEHAPAFGFHPNCGVWVSICASPALKELELTSIIAHPSGILAGIERLRNRVVPQEVEDGLIGDALEERERMRRCGATSWELAVFDVKTAWYAIVDSIRIQFT